MRFYAPSQMRSAKDVAGYNKMKYRLEGQNSAEELKRRDLKAALEEKERQARAKASKEDFMAEKEDDLRLLEAGLEGGGGGGGGPPVLVPKAVDADVADSDDSDESDSDDDDDDEAELLAELARIKKEREEEAARKAAEEAAAAEVADRQEVAAGNPLLQDKLAGAVEGNFALKRRWDDDVVFKNQARNEPKQQRRFVNDTLRSDFHRRFLDRYIR
jgi:protein CWC15